MSILSDISPAEIVGRLKYDSKVFNTILEKVEDDGYFGLLFDNFRAIFEKEIAYAFKGRLIRTQKNEVRQQVA